MPDQTIQLNLEKEICPYTLIQALKKAKEIEADIKKGASVLEVIVDHPPAVDNFPAEFGKRGYQTKVEKLGPARWQVLISA